MWFIRFHIVFTWTFFRRQILPRLAPVISDGEVLASDGRVVALVVPARHDALQGVLEGERIDSGTCSASLNRSDRLRPGRQFTVSYLITNLGVVHK